MDHGLGPAEPTHGLTMLDDLVVHRRALECEHRTTGPGKGEAPGRQPIQWSNGPRGHDVGRAQATGALLGPGADDLDPVEAQIVDDLVQESHAPGQRFDQDHMKIGASHRHYDTGQTSTGTYVYDIRPRRYEASDGRAIE
jgi:hypothetical protein